MKRALWVVTVLFFALFLEGCGVVVIEDGQAGVRADFGKIMDQPVRTGWHFYIPGFSWVETWNVKTQEIKETAQVPSSEGLISTLDVSVLYSVDGPNVVKVRKTIGSDYRETVLEPYIREAIRNIVSGYQVKALYSDAGRKEIGKKIYDFLNEKLVERGIRVQDILLRDVRLPSSFSQSIELKLKAEQEALQKEFELLKAKKDAEIEVARAEGVAKSNAIISNSITANYLRYKWIDGMQTNHMQVVYVPTESNLPILEGARWMQYEKDDKQQRKTGEKGE